jgi:DNA-binding GntR family transcriptional regulator
MQQLADAPQVRNLRDHVYFDLRGALMSGRFVPGQKMPIRSIAAALGTSPMPVREAIRRLISEGALEGESNRAVRVPIMTQTRMLELRDIRVALEGLAASHAAEKIDSEELARLRMLMLELSTARARGDHAMDMNRMGQFQLSVCRAARMPTLLRLIENLWVQTGPYMNLLFPAYIRTRPDWRARLCAALERRDSAAAKAEIERDVHDALTYIAGLADQDGRIVPRPLPEQSRNRAGRGRRPERGRDEIETSGRSKAAMSPS